MLKTPSPIIPIILAQKGGKMHPIYNVLERFQGILPLDCTYERTCSGTPWNCVKGYLGHPGIMRKGEKKKLANFWAEKDGICLKILNHL